MGRLPIEVSTLKSRDRFHPPGPGEQRRRHLEADRLGGLEIDPHCRISTWLMPAHRDP